MPVKGWVKWWLYDCLQSQPTGKRRIFKGDYRKKDSEEEEEYQKKVIPKSCLPLRSYPVSLLLVVRILLLLLMPSVCVPSSMCKLFLTVWPFTKNPCSLVLFPLLPFVPVTSNMNNYKNLNKVRKHLESQYTRNPIDISS